MMCMEISNRNIRLSAFLTLNYLDTWICCFKLCTVNAITCLWKYKMEKIEVIKLRLSSFLLLMLWLRLAVDQWTLFIQAQVDEMPWNKARYESCVSFQKSPYAKQKKKMQIVSGMLVTWTVELTWMYWTLEARFPWVIIVCSLYPFLSLLNVNIKEFCLGSFSHCSKINLLKSESKVKNGNKNIIKL